MKRASIYVMAALATALGMAGFQPAEAGERGKSQGHAVLESTMFTEYKAMDGHPMKSAIRSFMPTRILTSNLQYHRRAVRIRDLSGPTCTGETALPATSSGYTGRVLAKNHKSLQAQIMRSTFGKVGKQDVKYDADEPGCGWRVDTRIETKDNILPTTCRMERF